MAPSAPAQHRRRPTKIISRSIRGAPNAPQADARRAALAAPRLAAEERADWDDAARADRIEAYEAFLNRWPDGANAEEARARLDYLWNTDEGAWIRARASEFARRLRRFPARLSALAVRDRSAPGARRFPRQDDYAWDSARRRDIDARVRALSARICRTAITAATPSGASINCASTIAPPGIAPRAATASTPTTIYRSTLARRRLSRRCVAPHRSVARRAEQSAAATAAAACRHRRRRHRTSAATAAAAGVTAATASAGRRRHRHRRRRRRRAATAATAAATATAAAAAAAAASGDEDERQPPRPHRTTSDRNADAALAFRARGAR